MIIGNKGKGDTMAQRAMSLLHQGWKKIECIWIF